MSKTDDGGLTANDGKGSGDDKSDTDTTLTRLKLSNKYNRSNFTRVDNSLRSLMENNAKYSLIEENFTKLSKIQDSLAKNTAAIFELPPELLNEAMLNNELKTCDRYDNTFSEISNLIGTYKHVPTAEGHSTSAMHHDAEGSESDEDDFRDARERPKSTPQIKFAPIKLPTFSGDVTIGENNFTDWLNLFNVSVEHITDDSIKHIYLIQSLKGKALKLVSNIPASKIGFANALSILTQHFGNQKRTLHLTLKALVHYEVPHLQANIAPSTTYRDNWSSLLTLVRGIQNAKKDGFTSEDLLTSLVQMKLNPNISVEVERIISNKTDPTSLDEMFNIINNLIMSHEVSECSRSFSTKPNISTPAINDQRGGSSNNNRAPKCVFCGPKVTDHYSSRCPNDMNVNATREKVKEFRCCFNCILPGNLPNSHNAINCPTKNKKCHHCSGSHHSLLCFKGKDSSTERSQNEDRK